MSETVKTTEQIACEAATLLGRIAEQLKPFGNQKYDDMGTIVVPLHINSGDARTLSHLLNGADIHVIEAGTSVPSPDDADAVHEDDYATRLRDLIAIEYLKTCSDKMMQACHAGGHSPSTGLRVTARHAYDMADAMLAARELRNAPAS